MSTAFASLGPEHFPFTVTLLDDETNEVLHQQTVKGPGVLIVPGFAPRKVNTLVRYATGSYILSTHDGQTLTQEPGP